MKIINYLLNLISGRTTCAIDMYDLYTSRYYFLYEHRKRKKDYKEHLENNTLNKLNDYMFAEFGETINKKHKNEVIDCTVIFLKYISVNYSYFPGGEIFENEFDKIIIKNVEKFILKNPK